MPPPQAQLEQSEADLRTLGSEFQELRGLLAQRDTQVVQLRATISTLSGQLQAGQGKEVRGRGWGGRGGM